MTKGPVVYTFDESNGQIKAKATLPDAAYALILYTDYTTGLVGLGNGQLITMDFSTGEFSSDIFDTGRQISEISGFGTFLAMKSYASSDLYIITPHIARDLT